MKTDRNLYRGKRLDNGEWVTGHLFVDNDDQIQNNNPKERRYYILTWLVAMNCTIANATATAARVNPSTICQSTGLHDKNGVLIFESDVVAVPVHRHGSGQAWYSTSNIHHGNTLYTAHAVIKWYVNRFIISELPITKKQIEEIESPKGKERNRQAAYIYRHLLEREDKARKLEVIGNIHDNPEYLKEVCGG